MSTDDSALDPAQLAALVEQVTITGDVSDTERISRIKQLEALKSACAAAQALETALVFRSQAAAPGSSDHQQDKARRSTVAQIALARKVSPRVGGRYLGLAVALTQEMPNTLAALAVGEISEWRAMLVARETALLSKAHRMQVDEELAGRLGALGDKQIAREAARIAYRLDKEQAVKRHQKAVTERCVSVRPAPEGMAYVSALLPLVPAVSVFAALNAHAAGAKAGGDPRGRGQLMADEFVRRLTGSASAAPENFDPIGVPAGVDLSIQLVMTDRTLLDGAPDPATLTGFGPIPAALARRVACGSEQVKVWVRRLFTDPQAGQLAAMDSKRRLFPHAIRDFIITRDQVCRTNWCEAPIRHADHVTSVADGGPTKVTNGQGRCESCNYVKESPGWTTISNVDGTVVISTPTGHTYENRPSPPPRSKPWADVVGLGERRLAQLIEFAA